MNKHAVPPFITNLSCIFDSNLDCSRRNRNRTRNGQSRQAVYKNRTTKQSLKYLEAAANDINPQHRYGQDLLPTLTAIRPTIPLSHQTQSNQASEASKSYSAQTANLHSHGRRSGPSSAFSPSPCGSSVCDLSALHLHATNPYTVRYDRCRTIIQNVHSSTQVLIYLPTLPT